MHNKPLITYLILQELKHHQLMAGLRKLGFETDLHTLSLLEVIQPLLGIALTENNELPEVSDQLSEMHGNCLCQAEQLPITVLGTELEPLAEKCYQTLVACVHLESKKQTRV